MFLDRSKRWAYQQPKIRICPMGLMVLSVPVASDGICYGAVSCSAWVEEGTEGMTLGSIVSYSKATAALRQRLQKAFFDIPAFTVPGLFESQKLLRDLCGDLAALYRQRREERRRLLEGSGLLAGVRKLGESARLDGFPRLAGTLALPSFFLPPGPQAGAGAVQPPPPKVIPRTEWLIIAQVTVKSTSYRDRD